MAPISAVNHIQDKSILDVLRQLSQRIVMRRQQLKENAVNLVNTMMIAADTTKMLPVHYEYAAPEEKYRKAVSSGYQQLVKSIQITRQRLEAFSSFLREMPAALIVTDNQHRIITANPAAEKLFGQSSKQLQKTRLAQLLNDSVVAVDPADPESPRPLTPFNALNQLKKTKGEELLVQKKGSTPTFLKVQQQSNSNYSLVVFRSVGEELSTLSKNTVERRKATIQNMAAYVESQLAPSLSQAHADLRVMAGVVKRLPQKDQILPSLTQCQQNLGRLSITHSLLDWLVRIETNQLRLSVPEEVKLSEITEKVRNQFAIWLKERGIKLEVADEGSWMLCDETCVEVLLSSALTHAVAACKGDSIHLTLGRSKVRSEDKVELRYEFEAEAPSEEFLADLAQPYRRQNTSFLDHQQKGSVLGLYVAQQLARLLDGEAHLEVAD
ncbi:MAG TPA: PAS domain S-box protein, partial [Gemmatales bacterium]|nr:PAS domain S-box protein [Gemmatales bacterium]